MESVKKKPKKIDVEMSSPQRDKPSQPLRASKPSLMSRLFSRGGKKSAQPSAEKENIQQPSSLDDSPRKEKKNFNIPKIDLNSSSDDPLTDQSPAADFQLGKEENTKSSTAAAEEPEQATASSSDDLPQKERKEKFRLFSRKQKAPEAEDVFGEDSQKPKKEKKKRPEKDESVLELNLIPEELNKYSESELPRRLFKSGLAIFLTLLAIIGAYLGITWYQLNINSQIEGLGETIASVNQTIAEEEAIRNNSEDLQQRLAALESLLDKHVYWTNFFEQLEKNTLPQVYYLNFAMTGTDRLILSAVTDSYSSVAKQIVAFEQADDFVQDVKVSGAAARLNQDEGTLIGVDFNVELGFQPGVFLESNGN